MVMAGAAIGAAAAQAQPIAPLPLPSDARELDAMLAARDWNNLGAALSRAVAEEPLMRRMNWLQTRTDAGGGFLLPILHARDLWARGERLNQPDGAKDMRVTAVLMTFYAIELIVIDGMKCADETAPGHRMDQLFEARAPTLVFMSKQAAGLKARVADAAIAYEKKTAPLRKEDDLICREGMAEMQAGLERGTQRKVPTAPGDVGQTIKVAPPPGWSPDFVSSKTYLPLQQAARAKMRANLLTLVE